MPNIGKATHWCRGKRAGTLLLLAACWASCGCSLHGARAYTSSDPLEPIVSFEVSSDCSISIASKHARLSAQAIDLVDAGSRFELIVQNSLGRGYRLTDHDSGNGQHQFTVVGGESIWTFTFPDRAGEPGLVREYHRPSGSKEPSLANLREYCSLDVLTYFPHGGAEEAP